MSPWLQKLRARVRESAQRGVPVIVIAQMEKLAPETVESWCEGIAVTPPPPASRHNGDKTHCLQGHLLDGDNLHLGNRADGSVRRECRACMAERTRAYNARRRAGRPLARHWCAVIIDGRQYDRARRVGDIVRVGAPRHQVKYQWASVQFYAVKDTPDERVQQAWHDGPAAPAKARAA